MAWWMTGLLLLTMAAGNDGWQTYVNSRFGFTVDYPAGLLHAMPGPANGDGLEFRSRNGKASFTAAAIWMDTTSNVESAGMAEEKCVDSHATYKLMRPAMWVVSCPIAGGGLFYGKGVRSHDVESSLYATYPETERAVWDPVVARMAKSLSAPHPD